MKRKKFKMPEGDFREIPHAILTQMGVRGKGGIIGDLHIPYQDHTACSTAINYLIDKKHTDYLIINGDLLDFYMLSTWEKDPTKRNFSKELELYHNTLLQLSSVFKTIVYKLGNHEERYIRYMRRNAKELLGVKRFNLESLLTKNDDGHNIIKNLKMVDENRVIHAGRLNIIHGHEYKFAIQNPVNPARGLFLRSKANTLCNHFHQTSHHSEANIRGTNTACWSIGCLCILDPDYAPINKWNHGFALLDFGRKGDMFNVQNKTIIKRRDVV